MADLWVPPGHFYSPLADPADPFVQRAMDREAVAEEPLARFGISERTMMRWFGICALAYSAHRFTELSVEGSFYHYDNPNFPLADAVALMAFLTVKTPARYVEVGSGYSSCAAVDIAIRQRLSVEMTFIDPRPELAWRLLRGSPWSSGIVAQPVQKVPTETFLALESGDILFIDSSHVGKTGSDVLDYLFRILPALRTGVLVHIHDIFYPFEYPRSWIEGENRSWNEAYLLRAFLAENPRFRVLYMSDWFFKCRRSLLETAMPGCVAHRGASLWMEATGTPDRPTAA